MLPPWCGRAILAPPSKAFSYTLLRAFRVDQADVDREGDGFDPRANVQLCADLIQIARHRGWSRVRVAGDETFRREVWIQAQALGLEVAGHRPRDRDRQAAGQETPHPAPERSGVPERLVRAAVVVRRLITDPQVQVRLLEGAWARARESVVRDRSRDRDHTR